MISAFAVYKSTSKSSDFKTKKTLLLKNKKRGKLPKKSINKHEYNIPAERLQEKSIPDTASKPSIRTKRKRESSKNSEIGIKNNRITLSSENNKEVRKVSLLQHAEEEVSLKRKAKCVNNIKVFNAVQRLHNGIEHKNIQITDIPLPRNTKKVYLIQRKKLKGNNFKTEQLHLRNLTKVDAIDGDILKKPLDLLNYLLAPIKVSEFFNTYWETKPLHIVRNRVDYFKNILSSKQIDTILRENLVHYTRNVDVVTYENGIRQTHNPEGRAIPANVWDYYLNGCSVRIMNPQTYNQKVRDLLSTLQEYFGTMVGVNVYLTPPGSQGFAPHYDDIEAFVLQLEGHKNWKLYTPRFDREILPRYSSENLSREELGVPIKELTLQPGDMLYFPRGYIHEACTDSDAHSLHITVSVYQNTAYVDLLEKLLPQVLKSASECDVNFRKGLPLNYLQHVGIINSNKTTPERKQIINHVKELMHKLVDYMSVDVAADQLGRKFMYDAMPPNLSTGEKQRSCREDGDRMENGKVSNVVTFNPDSMIRLVRYYSQRLVQEENNARIYYCTENANVYRGEEEQYLELDNELIDTVKALQNKYPEYESIENLPGGDEVKKIQVVSDLWERGLIITKEPLDVEDE